MYKSVNGSSHPPEKPNAFKKVNRISSSYHFIARLVRLAHEKCIVNDDRFVSWVARGWQFGFDRNYSPYKSASTCQSGGIVFLSLS